MTTFASAPVTLQSLKAAARASRANIESLVNDAADKRAAAASKHWLALVAAVQRDFPVLTPYIKDYNGVPPPGAVDNIGVSGGKEVFDGERPESHKVEHDTYPPWYVTTSAVVVVNVPGHVPISLIYHWPDAHTGWQRARRSGGRRNGNISVPHLWSVCTDEDYEDAGWFKSNRVHETDDLGEALLHAEESYHEREVVLVAVPSALERKERVEKIRAAAAENKKTEEDRLLEALRLFVCRHAPSSE